MLDRPLFKRLLQTDEFMYYQSFLFKEDFAIPIKAAIGVVLKADLIRLYKNSYEMFQDDDVSFWADYYTGLPNGSTSKQLADSEIYWFEKYLGQPKMPLEAWMPNTMSEVIRDISENNQKLQKYQPIVVKKNEDEFISEYWENKKLALDEERKTKEIMKSLQTSDPDIVARKEAWIKANFIDYLAGYFVRHPLSLMSDSTKSEWEFKVREDVIKSVRTGIMSATGALAYYESVLDLIAGSKTEAEFIKNMEDIQKPIPSHPLVKYMYQDLKEYSQ